MLSSSLHITGGSETIDGRWLRQRARETMRVIPPPILQKAYAARTKGVTGLYLLVFLYNPVEIGTHNALLLLATVLVRYAFVWQMGAAQREGPVAPLTTMLLNQLLSTDAVDTITLARASCPSRTDKVKCLLMRMTNVVTMAIKSDAWINLEWMDRRDGGPMQRPYPRQFAWRLQVVEPTATTRGPAKCPQMGSAPVTFTATGW